uniref:hypothetical protein n=1 Tax=Pseudomonas viridiflava TaxID=33069 RepID=UPI00197D9FEF
MADELQLDTPMREAFKVFHEPGDVILGGTLKVDFSDIVVQKQKEKQRAFCGGPSASALWPIRS